MFIRIRPYSIFESGSESSLTRLSQSHKAEFTSVIEYLWLKSNEVSELYGKTPEPAGDPANRIAAGPCGNKKVERMKNHLYNLSPLNAAGSKYINQLGMKEYLNEYQGRVA